VTWISNKRLLTDRSSHYSLKVRRSYSSPSYIGGGSERPGEKGFVGETRKKKEDRKPGEKFKEQKQRRMMNRDSQIGQHSHIRGGISLDSGKKKTREPGQKRNHRGHIGRINFPKARPRG